MRAFVAGATGLTGRHAVEVLAKGGHEVIAHVRPDSPRLAEWSERFASLGARVSSTPWEASAIASTIAKEGPGLVLGVLGTTRARAKRVEAAGGDPSRESYDAVDVALTEMLIAACAAIEPRPRFVYLSSTGTTEGTSNAYLAARARVEATLKKSGVPYTIARPSFIAGERDEPRGMEKVAVKLADAGLGLLGALGGRGLRDRYASMTGEELARALVTLGLDPAWTDRIAETEDLRRALR